ncbi:MAG TPA: hypothetical protein VJI67_00270 [archaeon]|nr:hypothetical protein [archaeon]HLD80818.1 hypothetical protein [archaeon]
MARSAKWRPLSEAPLGKLRERVLRFWDNLSGKPSEKYEFLHVKTKTARVTGVRRSGTGLYPGDARFDWKNTKMTVESERFRRPLKIEAKQMAHANTPEAGQFVVAVDAAMRGGNLERGQVQSTVRSTAYDSKTGKRLGNSMHGVHNTPGSKERKKARR